MRDLNIITNDDRALIRQLIDTERRNMEREIMESARIEGVVQTNKTRHFKRLSDLADLFAATPMPQIMRTPLLPPQINGNGWNSHELKKD